MMNTYRLSFIGILILCFSSSVAYSQPQFQIPVKFTLDAPAKSQTLSIGVKDGNSSGLDDAQGFGAFKETPLAPKPPTPEFEIRLTDPIVSGSHKDIRDFVSQNQVDIYTIELHGTNLETNTGTVTISWPDSSVLKQFGTAWEIDDGDAAGGLFPTTDMITNKNVTFQTILSGPLSIHIKKTGAKQAIGFVEHVLPKYFGAKSNTTVNSTRTPFTSAIGIIGLVPKQNYDLRAALASVDEQADQYGGGSLWNGSQFLDQTVPSAFVTDSTGAALVWLTFQPGADAIRFEAGQNHGIRISVTLSGTPIPSIPTFISGQILKALDISMIPRSSATPTDDGAFLKGSSKGQANGKYLLLFDNSTGTGDPIYSTQIRPSIATNPAQTELPSVVDQVFSQTGASNLGDFAAVIPTNDVNALGIRRIELRNKNNSIFAAESSATGIWGIVNTTTVSRREVVDISGLTPFEVKKTIIVPISEARKDLNNDRIPDHSVTKDTLSVIGVITTNNFQSSQTSYYLQDTSAAIQLFSFNPFVPGLQPGDSVLVTGTITIFRGSTEIIPLVTDTVHIVLLKKNAILPKPKPLSLKTYISDPETYESQLIRIDTLHKKSGMWPSVGANSNIIVTNNSKQDSVILFIDQDTNIDGWKEPVFPINVTGIAGQFSTGTSVYNNGYEIIPRDTNDIKPSIILNVQEMSSVVPVEYRLYQNFPNPFNPSTTIRFTVKESGNARVFVTNILGQHVAELYNDHAEPSVLYSVRFNGSELASGVYFTTFISGGQSQIKKILLVK